ncbi:MAG: heavy-metal-associated domain-containing protein [Chitinophagaceae bacterium]
MKILKFKTTITCSGCLGKVTPLLNEVLGEDNWEVDVKTPEKVLTIASDEEINTADVVNALEGAGYKAEMIS